MAEEIVTQETGEEDAGAEKQEAKGKSAHFYIPHISLFTEGNHYIGSTNTFNFKIAPGDDCLKAYIWYGLNCFELSEMLTERSFAKDEEGLTELGRFIDDEYAAYKAKVADGSVKSRRTYREIEKKDEE